MQVQKLSRRQINVEFHSTKMDTTKIKIKFVDNQQRNYQYNW